MQRRLSATYQNDLSALRGQVSADAYQRLHELALGIQAAHEDPRASDEGLDALIEEYIALRAHALAQGSH